MKSSKTNLAEKEELPKKVIQTKKEQNPKLGGWLFNVEGTIAEPWTTAEDILKDEKLQEEIENVRELFDQVKKQKGHK